MHRHTATDYFLLDSFAMYNVGSGFKLDTSAGALIRGNHMYSNGVGININIGSQALRIVNNYGEDATALLINTMNPSESVVLTGNIFEGTCCITANDGNSSVQSSSNVFRTEGTVMHPSGNRGHVLSVSSIGDSFVSSAAHFNVSGGVRVSTPKMRVLASAAELKADDEMAAAARCATSMDCSLLGDCVARSCKCDPGWRGADCSELALGPVASEDDALAYAQSTYSSWGANVVYDPQTKLYAMFTREIAAHCGMGTWQHNQHVTLSTSPKPEGPGRFTRQNVLVPAYADNPQGLLLADNKTWLVYHHSDGEEAVKSLVGPCNANGTTAGMTPQAAPDPTRVHVEPDAALLDYGCGWTVQGRQGECIKHQGQQGIDLQQPSAVPAQERIDRAGLHGLGRQHRQQNRLATATWRRFAALP